MSANAVEVEILAPMQRLFLPPQRMDEAQQIAALREYIGALQRFHVDDLRAAWQSVRDSHTTRAWPAPAAFVLEARKARSARAPERSGRGGDKPSPSTYWKKWEAVRAGAEALKACERGVSWAFKAAILSGKEPYEINLTELEMAKVSAARTAELIRTDERVAYKGRWLQFSNDNAAIAMKMWRSILVKNDQTKEEIYRAHGISG